MSRSYKKTPYCGDRKHKEDKRKANKAFRNKTDRMKLEDQIAPGTFKKFYERWDICDYYSIFTLEEYLYIRKARRGFHGYRRGEYDEAQEIQNWHKWYKRK